MQNRIEQFLATLTEPVKRSFALRLTGQLVYAWLGIYALFLWKDAELIWGPDSVLKPFAGKGSWIENQMYMLIYRPERFYFIFIPHLIACALAVTDKWWTFMPRTISWLTGLMLYYGAIQAHNSGMLVILLLAFYLIPAQTNTSNPYRHVLNHFSLYAGMTQVMLCYLFSAIFKLNGMQWLSGDALYYALQLDRFSHPWIMQPEISGQHLLLRVLTWGALAYQLTFPILVIVLKHKRVWFLMLGVLMHLFIAVVMNLWDFGLAICVCYALFLPEKMFKRTAA